MALEYSFPIFLTNGSANALQVFVLLRQILKQRSSHYQQLAASIRKTCSISKTNQLHLLLGGVNAKNNIMNSIYSILCKSGWAIFNLIWHLNFNIELHLRNSSAKKKGSRNSVIKKHYTVWDGKSVTVEIYQESETKKVPHIEKSVIRAAAWRISNIPVNKISQDPGRKEYHTQTYTQM